ncbi:hypothetical protein OAM32_02095 [Alphaproteobacteria bacterium]|nr:hypothetical protein [Alphaproteobacteria bacterium]
MEKSVAYLDDQDYEFSLLIARKNVDHFYTKFGFFGASSYQSLKCQFEEGKFEKSSLLVTSRLKIRLNIKGFFIQIINNVLEHRVALKVSGIAPSIVLLL